MTNSKMTFTVKIDGIIAIIAGVLILIMPTIINYVVAIYLLVSGILQLTKK